MKYIIYLCKNTVTSKVYIGQTKATLDKRKQQHLNAVFANRENNKFHNAIRKYGEQHFEWTILQDNIDVDVIDELEIHYIAKYDSHKNGYNSTVGGAGVRGYVFTDEDKAKMSIGAKNRPPISEITREKHRRNGQKPMKESTRLKLIERTYSCETIDKFKKAQQKRFIENPDSFKSQLKRKVYQFDLNGVFLAEYDSGTDAAKIINGTQGKISECCNGKRKKHKGFYWSYSNDFSSQSIIPLV